MVGWLEDTGLSETGLIRFCFWLWFSRFVVWWLGIYLCFIRRNLWPGSRDFLADFVRMFGGIMGQMGLQRAWLDGSIISISLRKSCTAKHVSGFPLSMWKCVCSYIAFPNCYLQFKRAPSPASELMTVANITNLACAFHNFSTLPIVLKSSRLLRSGMLSPAVSPPPPVVKNNVTHHISLLTTTRPQKTKKTPAQNSSCHTPGFPTP